MAGAAALPLLARASVGCDKDAARPSAALARDPRTRPVAVDGVPSEMAPTPALNSLFAARELMESNAASPPTRHELRTPIAAIRPGAGRPRSRRRLRRAPAHVGWLRPRQPPRQ
jgi:hypothetical protein